MRKLVKKIIAIYLITDRANKYNTFLMHRELDFDTMLRYDRAFNRLIKLLDKYRL